MNAFTALVIASMFLSFFHSPTFADRPDRRQVKQRARIGQGVKSGEITREEAKNLRKDQREFRQQEREAKKDGVVTDKEAYDLEQSQDAMSKKIHSEKHDEETRDSGQ